MRNSGILPEGTIPVYKIVPVHNIIYIEPSPPFFYRLKNIKNQYRVVKYRIIIRGYWIEFKGAGEVL